METKDLIKVLRGKTILDVTDIAAQGLLLEAADRIEDFEKIAEFYHRELEKALSEREKASDVAREIFEDIETYLFYHENISNTVYKTIDKNIFETIKKKYTEGGE